MYPLKVNNENSQSISQIVRQTLLKDLSIDEKVELIIKHIQNENNNIDQVSNPFLSNLQHFSNIERLKVGGFGMVFKGTHVLDLNTYALKLIPVNLEVGLQESLYRKLKEVRYLSKLQHTNIIRYYNSWIELSNNSLQNSHPINNMSLIGNNITSTEVSNYTSTEISIDSDMSSELQPDRAYDIDSKRLVCFSELVGHDYSNYYQFAYLFLQMEFVECNFKEWIGNYKPNKIQIKKVINDIINGLQFLHGQEDPIIHCDLKPDNILIENPLTKPIAKIADFGLVRSQLEIENYPEKNIGTYLYSAPETKTGKMTTASDIFSLGILLYEVGFVFTTEMERIKSIQYFREGTYLTGNLLDKMISINPNLRPTLKTVKKELNLLI